MTWQQWWTAMTQWWCDDDTMIKVTTWQCDGHNDTASMQQWRWHWQSDNDDNDGDG